MSRKQKANQRASDEIPTGFDPAKWEQAVRDGKVIVVDTPLRPRSSGAPRAIAATTWFAGLTWQAFRMRLARRFSLAGGNAVTSAEADDVCAPPCREDEGCQE